MIINFYGALGESSRSVELDRLMTVRELLASAGYVAGPDLRAFVNDVQMEMDDLVIEDGEMSVFKSIQGGDGGGGPVTPTYSSSAAGNVASGTRIWIVIHPSSMLSGYPPARNNTVVKFYTQSGVPDNASTIVFTGTAQVAALPARIGLGARTTASVIDDLTLSSGDLNSLDSGLGTWTRFSPIAYNGGMNLTRADSSQPGIIADVYRGTDRVEEATEAQ